MEEGCEIEELRGFFLARIEGITGPRHLEALLAPAEGKERESAWKKVFLVFFEWFLKERYVRYLLSEGKMTDKRMYIEYKNTMISKYVKVAKEFYKGEFEKKE